MTRYRVRPAPSATELAVLYSEPHQHLAYGYGHTLRVDCTIALAASAGYDILHHEVGTPAPLIADLSCGDAAVPRALAGRFRTRLFLGDYAHSPHHNVTGPIEQTVPDLRDRMQGAWVDLFICGETIEHLDDPDAVLAEIWTMSRYLLVSTPLNEEMNGSPGHLWTWGLNDIGDMLNAAGWDAAEAHTVILDLPDTLSYQIWLVKRRDLTLN